MNKNTRNLCALINNASTFYPKKITDIDSDDWDKLMSSNLKAFRFEDINLSQSSESISVIFLG